MSRNVARTKGPGIRGTYLIQRPPERPMIRAILSVHACHLVPSPMSSGSWTIWTPGTTGARISHMESSRTRKRRDMSTAKRKNLSASGWLPCAIIFRREPAGPNRQHHSRLPMVGSVAHVPGRARRRQPTPEVATGTRWTGRLRGQSSYGFDSRRRPFRRRRHSAAPIARAQIVEKPPQHPAFDGEAAFRINHRPLSHCGRSENAKASPRPSGRCSSAPAAPPIRNCRVRWSHGSKRGDTILGPIGSYESLEQPNPVLVLVVVSKFPSPFRVRG